MHWVYIPPKLLSNNTDDYVFYYTVNGSNISFINLKNS